jgi:hypothetical protein
MSSSGRELVPSFDDRNPHFVPLVALGLAAGGATVDTASSTVEGADLCFSHSPMRNCTPKPAPNARGSLRSAFTRGAKSIHLRSTDDATW